MMKKPKRFNLHTKDKVANFGIMTNSSCSFCNRPNETLDHLFFACLVTRRIWREVLYWSNMVHHVMSCDNYNQDHTTLWTIDNLKHTFGKWSLIACIYCLWLERNRRVFTKECKDVYAISGVIKNMVWERASSYSNFLSRPVDRIIVKKQGLSNCIFQQNGG